MQQGVVALALDPEPDMSGCGETIIAGLQTKAVRIQGRWCAQHLDCGMQRLPQSGMHGQIAEADGKCWSGEVQAQQESNRFEFQG